MQGNTLIKPLSEKSKWLYACGETGQQIVVCMLGMYMMFFYTNVLGISPAAAGTLFLVARIWDAVNDPIAGMIIDKTNTKFGKCRPFLMTCAIPFGVFLVLTFTAPNLSPTMKLVWAYVTYIGQGMLYTITGISYLTLMSRIAKTSAERVDMRGKIVIIATIGTWIASSQTMNLVTFFGDGGENLSKGFTIVASIYACIVVIAYLTVCYAVKDHDVKEEIVSKPKSELSGSGAVREAMLGLIKNPMLRYACAMNFLYVLISFIPMGALFYYLSYNLNRPEAMAYVQTAATVSYLLVGATISKITQKIGKVNAVIIFICFAIVCLAVRYITNDTSYPLMILMGACVEFSFGFYGNVNHPIMMDAIDYDEYVNGKRQDGLFIASFNFVSKLCIGVSGAVVGFLLSATGFDQTLAVQPDSVYLGLKNMMFLVPAILSVIFIFVLLSYKKYEKNMPNIYIELEKRRAEKS